MHVREFLLWTIFIGILLLLGCVVRGEYDPFTFELPRIAIPWMLGCMIIYYVFEPTQGRRRN